MRALLVTSGYPPEHSGSGRRLHETYMRLRAVHPELSWRVLTRRRGDAAVEGPESVTAVPAPASSGVLAQPGLWLREAAAARRLLAGGLLAGIDLVHCAGFTWLTPLVARAARERGVPVVRELTSQGDGGVGRSLGGRLFAVPVRGLNRLASLLVAISPALGRDARAAGAAAPLWVRPNPTDLARFRLPAPDERRVAREFLATLLPGLEDRHPVVFQLGRIRPLKNQLLTAQAMRLLPPEFRLVLAGPVFPEDGGYLARIREAAAGPDLAGRVAVLADYLPDPERIFRGADILAFPSTHEGLGNVMLEALCSGLPVAAAHIPGVTDWIVRPGENGALCERTAADLARCLAEAGRLLPRREALAAAAAGRFGAEFLDGRLWDLMAALAHGEGLPADIP
mgnify:CR=1 FL=1